MKIRIPIPQINTKSPYFIISCIVLSITLLLTFCVPKENWQKLFSGKLFKFATVFRSNDFVSGLSGNWNDPYTWGGSFVSSEPYDLDFGPNGEIYVADYGKITVLNPNGTISATYNIDDEPAFNGIQVYEGKIYAPSNLGVMYVLNTDGTVNTTYDGDTFAPMTPYSVFIHNEDIYIADYDYNRVVVLNLDGTASTTYNLSFSPVDVSVTDNGNMYVAGTNSIFLLDVTGTEIAEYDGDVLAPICPTNLKLSPSGQIYANDYCNDRIIILDENGSSTASYDGDTFAPIYPFGMTLSENGEIYIADSANYTGDGRIVILNSDGTASTTYSTKIEATPDEDYPGANSDVIIIDDTVTLTRDENVHNLEIWNFGGTLDLNGFTLNVFGHSNIEGTLIENGGSINQISYSDLLLNTSLVLTEDLYVNDITITSEGSLDLNGYTIYVNGDWINQGGEFIANNGTVNLISTSTQSIFGENTFYNLKKINNAESILIFDSSNVTTITGRLTLKGTEITGDGEKLLNIQTNAMPYVFDSKITTNLSFPMGLAHDSLGNIYVSDKGSNTINKYDGDGNFILYFATNTPASTTIGFYDGQSQLVIDSEDNIWIANNANDNVIKYNSDGEYLDSFSVQDPYGIAVDNDGYIYVTSQNNSNGYSGKLIKYNPDFSTSTYVEYSSTQTYNPDALYDYYNNPLKIDPSGDYVYLMSGDLIVKLNTSNLSYVTHTEGPIEFPFGIPVSLDFDSLGNIYVSDSVGYIIKLNSNFEYITSWGRTIYNEDEEGNKIDGELNGPQQIMLDSLNNVYVADYWNGRIQKFISSSTVPFTLIHTNPTAQNIDIEYISITGSENQSSVPFSCLTGCVNGGYNSNWLFSSETGNPRTSRPRATVVYTVEPEISTPDHISISPNISEIFIGQSQQFTGTVYDKYNRVLLDSISWISSNESIGTINDYGIFTSVYPGTTTVTAKIGDVSTSTEIKVNYNPVLSSVSISPINPTIQRVSSLQFSSILLDQYGNNFATTTYWSNSNNTIGTINQNGLFTSKKKKGSSVITATAGSLSTSTTITVDNKIPLAEELMVEEQSVEENITTGLGTTEVEPVTEEPVYTTSENTSIISVTEKKDLISDITDSVKSAYKNIIITPEDIQAVKEVINTDVGSAVTKTISTTGVAAGAAAGVSAVAFANPITFAELWLLPAKLFGLLLGALGIRRRNREWGTVYDSITKRPLDPVYVSLISIETGKEVSSAITDIDGRYGFLVLPGKYRIEAKKTNYIQPSVKMKGKLYDEVYNDLYFGEEITITQEGETITKNIPMDSLSFDWNEFAKTKMNVNKFIKQKDLTWAKLSKLVFVIGALVSIIAVVAAPQPYNYIIVGFYLLAYILNFIVFKSKKSGTLTEKDTNAPLSFAIVKIYREGETIPLTKKIADKFGDYYALVPNGKYSISIDKKTDSGEYKEVFRTEEMEIKTGLINMDIII